MKIKFIIFGFILLFPAISFGQSNYDQERSNIIRIFAKYLTLNREFISTVDSGNHVQSADTNKMAEAFNEDSLSLALYKCRDRLLKGSDTVLACVMCDFLIGSRNSANEEPTWIYGEIFLSNPSLIESVLNSYDKKSRIILVQTLNDGFQFNVYGKPRSSRIDSLEKRFHQLETNDK